MILDRPQDIPDCSGDTCLHGGQCEDLVLDFLCHCRPGYSGRNCEVDVDECAAQPCVNGATCEVRGDELDLH